ncbi:MAG: small multi-drug export protein [Candidatus Bathyarchaeia archaeon]
MPDEHHTFSREKTAADQSSRVDLRPVTQEKTEEPLDALYDLLIVFALSVSPVSEVRGAIIYGTLAGIDPWVNFTISTAGNMFIAAVLWFSLGRLELFLRRKAEAGAERNSILGSFARWYCRHEERVSMRVRPYMRKYGVIGLAVFVAVPLPATGVWTANLAAFALGIREKAAFLSILIGALIASTVMLIISTPLGWLLT